MSPGEPTRVLVVDDSATFRRALRTWLAGMPDVELVGEACDGGEAVLQAAVLVPDMVLMDLMMPVLDGLGATRLLKRRTPPPFVVVLSVRNEDPIRRAAELAGADAFIWKGNLDEELTALFGHGPRRR
jgi:DNA-binding NarL/FixJ family response regulator